jgi:hypothetical protein
MSGGKTRWAVTKSSSRFALRRFRQEHSAGRASSQGGTLKQNGKQRRTPASNDFAIPPQGARRGRYPIQNQEQAVAALARVDAEGTAEEKRKVHSAVRKRYPNLRPDADRSDGLGRPDSGHPDAGRVGERSSLPAGRAPASQVPVPRIESGRTPSKAF